MVDAYFVEKDKIYKLLLFNSTDLRREEKFRPDSSGLIPSPKHVIIDRDEKGNIIDYVYRNEQSAEEMFKILGYEK